ncbi:MAG: ATP-binding cassette domain-containing protein [Candidatus Promineifilaceae bacterium]
MLAPRGSIFGFIGPSGCGKTTTIRLLLGVYEPSGGEVEIMSKSPNDFNSAGRRSSWWSRSRPTRPPRSATASRL